MPPRNHPTYAIILMVISMACFSAMNIAIRTLSHEMHTTQMVFLRNIIALLLVIIWAWYVQKKPPQFKTERLSGHFWRATVGIIAMQLWFYSLSIMEVTFATALSFTTPIFATIIAILFLKERAGIRRWSAIVVGFIGMWIILRPDMSAPNSGALFVIFSSMVMAVAGVMVKSLSKTERPETIVFYMCLFMTLWSILPAVFYWQSVSLTQWGLLFSIALFATIAQLLMAHAFIHADLVMLMPFDFTRLIFTSIFAYVFFGEVLDAHTLSGSALIVASAVYIAHREAKKRREILPVT